MTRATRDGRSPGVFMQPDRRAVASRPAAKRCDRTHPAVAGQRAHRRGSLRRPNVEGREQVEARAMTWSTLDFDGTLTVADPAPLLAAIVRGFGAAKAYGCGLMLIRRA